MKILMIEDGAKFPSELEFQLIALGLNPKSVSCMNVTTYLYTESLPEVVLFDRRSPTSHGDLVFLDLIKHPTFREIPLIIVDTKEVKLKNASTEAVRRFDSKISFSSIFELIRKLLPN